MFSSVLMVCTGNICRSPMAEYLLRARWDKPGVRVESAGIAALVGEPADADAMAVMRDHGIDMSPHRGRQLTPAMIAQCDLILVMEPMQQEWIIGRMPTARGRVHALSRWDAEEQVPDPFRRGRAAFEATYAQLDRCVDSWLLRLG